MTNDDEDETESLKEERDAADHALEDAGRTEGQMVEKVQEAMDLIRRGFYISALQPLREALAIAGVEEVKRE